LERFHYILVYGNLGPETTKAPLFVFTHVLDRMQTSMERPSAETNTARQVTQIALEGTFARALEQSYPKF
jgi:hypothetical protein